MESSFHFERGKFEKGKITATEVEVGMLCKFWVVVCEGCGAILSALHGFWFN